MQGQITLGDERVSRLGRFWLVTGEATWEHEIELGDL